MKGNLYDPTHEEATESAKANALKAEAVMAKSQEDLMKAKESGSLKVDSIPDNYRVFVAPVDRNTRFLINPKDRVIRSIVDPSSPTGKRDIESSGDIWLEFHDGVADINTSTPEGKRQLEWAMAHHDICRDIAEPMTEAWAMLKFGQTPRSREDPTVPRGLDIDKMLAGDPRALAVQNTLGSRARQALETLNAGDSA